MGELLDLELFRATRVAAGTWPPSREEMSLFRERCFHEMRQRQLTASRPVPTGTARPIRPPPAVTAPPKNDAEVLEQLDAELERLISKQLEESIERSMLDAGAEVGTAPSGSLE